MRCWPFLSRHMSFTVRDYNTAVDQYDRTWQVLDGTLYRLCVDHPGHRIWDALCAKLWIIARTYNTGVERSIISKRTQGSSLSQLAERLYQYHAEADEIVGEVREIAEPLDRANAPRLVALHGRFTNLITPITRRNQSPRSFVSKYLHFHAPVVPIIDSYADGVLPSIVPLRPSVKVFTKPKGGDGYYCKFVLRFLRLHEIAVAAGANPSAKRLDAYLLWKAEKRGDVRPEALAMGAS